MTRTETRRGQAMVETVVVMFFLCLAFFYAGDYANVLLTKTVIAHAAARGARARAVGFNDFMVTKTVRIASMGVAGECLTKEANGTSPLSTAALVSRSGSYLETEYEADTKGVLDFELWDPSRLGWTCAEPGGEYGELTMRVWQKAPVHLSDRDGPLRTVEGEVSIENHYSRYLR